MSVIRQLGGGNAGLDVLLQGKLDQFLLKVAEKNNTPLEIKVENSKNLSPTIRNVLGIAGTVGIAAVTAGTVTAGYEVNTMTADEFIKKDGTEKERGFWNSLGSAAIWIKDAFLGRRLSLTLGRERVAEYQKNITAFTKEVLSLKSDTSMNSIKNPILASALETSLRTAKLAKIDLTKPEEFAKIQKALIQSYINGEGYKNEGSNWSASIGVLMLLGAHRDAIGIEVLQTGPSIYNNIEGSLI